MPYASREARNAAQRRWYERNKEARRAQIREYKRDNREKINAHEREPERRTVRTAKRRKWRDANRERDNRTQRFWAKNNRERITRYGRKSYAKRREQRVLDAREWRARNPEYHLARSNETYRLKKNAISEETFASIEARVKGTKK